jgi:hypothetical protein
VSYIPARRNPTHGERFHQIKEHVIAIPSSHDGDTNGKVLDMLGDGGIVSDLSERDGDLGGLCEWRVGFVEDPEWRLSRGGVSVLPSKRIRIYDPV